MRAEERVLSAEQKSSIVATLKLRAGTPFDYTACGGVVCPELVEGLRASG